MTSPRQYEILDLRHFSAGQLRPLLIDEATRWERRLDWNYSAAIELLLDYLDDRVLPGFAAVQSGRVIGYAFAVFEAAKAIIGDAYAFGETEQQNNPLCDTLLSHLVEMLQATPGVDRIESQLLMFPSGSLAAPFLSRGFHPVTRLFMECALNPAQIAPELQLPSGLILERWRPELYDAAADLIYRCYLGHIDSEINDQYRSIHGSRRFLHNIVRFPGCGIFEGFNSWVLRNPHSETLQGLLLCSRVRADVAHITQVCLDPSLRGCGLGRGMVQTCSAHLAKSGVRKISLTVTQANHEARKLYDSLGFAVRHRFDAMAWGKPDTPTPPPIDFLA